MPTSNPLRIFGLVLLTMLGFWLLGTHSARAQDQSQIELGARLYAQNCAVCHGENGEGRVGATLAKNWPSIRPDLRIRETIEGGIPGSPMIAWLQANGGPLSEGDIDALVAYILTWETGGPRYIAPTPTFSSRTVITAIPNVEGDPSRGAVLFEQNCVVCHGPNGEGRVGATLAKSFASVRPDLAVKNTVSNGVSGSPMPAWSQSNGGPLSEQDINDVTAFVLTLAKSPVIVQPESTPEPKFQPTWLSGWGGVILGVLLFVLIVGFALWYQSRDNKPKPENKP
jgi:mono/diheme cytochrome c family protein